MKGNDVGHIRKQINDKVMPRGMENMIMLMFIQLQSELMKMVHIFSVPPLFLFIRGSVSVGEAAHLAYLTWICAFSMNAVCPLENAL